MTTPTIPLNKSARIARLGFRALNVPPDRNPTPANVPKAAEVVGLALARGYRHIDTAQTYGNERGVCRAIAH
ncbi:hypothetical protein [Paraburkholderia diazotrophica]|uniref:hypothetical protein n=1 Tax=Paraburkholderia diazotrophica TaxID=667676 RepID=UPI00317AFE2F